MIKKILTNADYKVFSNARCSAQANNIDGEKVKITLKKQKNSCLYLTQSCRLSEKRDDAVIAASYLFSVDNTVTEDSS